MTPEINKFFKILSSAKGIVVTLVIIILGIFIWKNFDFMSEITFTLKNESSTESKKDDVARLNFGTIFVPPTPRILPTIIVFEIVNTSKIVAKNAKINIDLGTAKAVAYEVIGPKIDDVSKSEPGTSLLNIDLKQIRPHENVFIYVQSSSSTFKRISISGSNTAYTNDYTLNDYLTKNKSKSTPTFFEWILILFGIFALAIFVMFAFGTLRKLNKKYDLGW